MASRNIPRYLILHHSVSPRDVAVNTAESSFNRTHKERFNFPAKGGSYIGYHYVIYGDGTLRQYREDTEVGAHCKEQKMNFQSIGICMSGDFGSGEGRLNEQLSNAQLKTLGTLLRRLQAEYKILDERVLPHRAFAVNPSTGKPYKDCYGSNLPDHPMELFAHAKVLTDLEWAQMYLPEVDWKKLEPELPKAFRALAQRVEWRKD